MMPSRPGADPYEPFVFRARTGWVACAVWAALSVVWIGMEWRTGFDGVLHRLPVVFTLATVVYAVFGRPSVLVDDRGVVLRNIVRDVRVPFHRLSTVTTQYCLTLVDTAGHRHRSWAAPAPSRFATARVTDGELRALSLDDEDGSAGIPASATLRSDAGAAAVAIRRAWRRSRLSPAPADRDQADDTVQETFAWPVLGALALFLALTVATELVG